MNRSVIHCFLFFLLFWSAKGYGMLPREVDIYSHPPRTIRVCCLFGSHVGIAVLPFIKLTAVTSIDKLGAHVYMGKSSENNGLLYSGRGGFIDMGHLRDVADWTAWIYTLIQNEKYRGCISRYLGYEGGIKSLEISVTDKMSNEDILLLSGRIAYDLAVWHEIATWFGVSSVPLISEQFSSFSVEDTYSNLLGALIGMEAIRSNLPYEEAMTTLIRKKLIELAVVETGKETLLALEDVRDLWWTRNEHLPSNKVVIVRQTTVYDTIYPLLIPGNLLSVMNPFPLSPPLITATGIPLTGFYDLRISPNFKFPMKNLFPGKKERFITQNDFPTLINEINRQYQSMFLTGLPNGDRAEGNFLLVRRFFKRIRQIGQRAAIS